MFAPVEQEKHKIFVLVMALNISRVKAHMALITLTVAHQQIIVTTPRVTNL